LEVREADRRYCASYFDTGGCAVWFNPVQAFLASPERENGAQAEAERLLGPPRVETLDE
jgi:hypothetical protein